MQGDVIDGYSVQEAASVLGVPEGRVWELLARGVIGGVPEGDSMRVYLKASSSAGPLAGVAAKPLRENGGESGEASAFRELLTEFRSLTERYGQALLALGEARGEVAGLRARVELLESRVDLRLAGSARKPIAWSPAPARGAVPPVASAAAGGEAEAPPDLRPSPPPRRERESRSGTRRRPAMPVAPSPAPRKSPRQRRAVAGIAEALARAEDPSTRALPHLAAEATTPAFPRPVSPGASGQPRSEVTPPLVPAAEDENTAPQTYSTDVVEPDWFADGDFAWLEAADREAVEGQAANRQAEPAAPVIVLDAIEESEGDAGAGEFEAAPVSLDASSDVARSIGEPIPPDEPSTAAALVRDTAPAPLGQPSPATLSLTEEELAQLAADEGWGPAEVDTIRGLIGSDEPAALELPGGVELDAALAALDAPSAEDDQWSKPHLDVPLPEPTLEVELAADIHSPEPSDGPSVPEAPPSNAALSPLSAPATPSVGAPPRPLTARPAPSEPSWLRGRRGAAATAFRTLRRLLPG